MKKLWIIIIIAACAIASVPLGITVWRSAGTHALESYRRTLSASGEKLSFSELAKTLSPLTNNSLAVITNCAHQLGQALLEPTNADHFTFVAAGRAQLEWATPEPLWQLADNRSRRMTWDDVGASLQSRSACLATLRQALKDTPPNAGPQRGFFEMATPVPAVRACTLWLASDALWSLRANKKEEALENIEALAHLADVHKEEYRLSSQMMRVAVAQNGLPLTWQALQRGGWDEPALLRLQNSWQGLDFLEAVERGLEGERCSGTEFTKKTAANVLPHARTPWMSKVLLNDGDLLFQLHHIESYVEQVRLLRAGTKGWNQVSITLDQLNLKLESLTNSPSRLRYFITLLSTPNFKRAVQTSVRRETERRQTVVGIALERYKAKHKQYPASLQQLIPEFLSGLPRDCMDAKPLRYQLKGNGAFVLYSVGEDGCDNGGDPSPDTAGIKPTLWAGRDMVWPLPPN